MSSGIWKKVLEGVKSDSINFDDPGVQTLNRFIISMIWLEIFISVACAAYSGIVLGDDSKILFLVIPMWILNILAGLGCMFYAIRMQKKIDSGITAHRALLFGYALCLGSYLIIYTIMMLIMNHWGLI